MSDENTFQYAKSKYFDHTVALEAEMSDFAYGKHAHEEYSFGVTLAGRQDFFAKGAYHHSNPGNVIVFNPGEVHDGESGIEDSLQYRMLYLHPDQFMPFLNSAGIKQRVDFQIPDTLSDDRHLRQHILQLTDLIADKNSSKLEQECAMYQMAEYIALRYGQSASANTQIHPDHCLLKAQTFIEDNISTDLSLEDISRAANLSKYHFLRLFKQHFNITPHQYILNSRLNRAKADLAAGKSLDDVVFNYGFSDLSHFNRRFKPVFGMTPKQYQLDVLTS
ncbi:AraC family transcriptional regulator [Marinomonas agarivorans]|nr:AraC family transcriptional regulator [Marinomonas agarivorans]